MNTIAPMPTTAREMHNCTVTAATFALEAISAAKTADDMPPAARATMRIDAGMAVRETRRAEGAARAGKNDLVHYHTYCAAKARRRAFDAINAEHGIDGEFRASNRLMTVKSPAALVRLAKSWQSA